MSMSTSQVAQLRAVGLCQGEGIQGLSEPNDPARSGTTVSSAKAGRALDRHALECRRQRGAVAVVSRQRLDQWSCRSTRLVEDEPERRRRGATALDVGGRPLEGGAERAARPAPDGAERSGDR
jgi:hypothetical protein